MNKTRLIDGRALAASLEAKLIERTKKLKQEPGLAIILVGNDPASEIYIKVKKQACERVGVRFELHRFYSNTLEDEICKRIATLNERPDVHGIVVQLPLPRHLDDDRIVASVSWPTDVDGFHPFRVKSLLGGKPIEPPSLVRSILLLIKQTRTALRHRHVAILANGEEFTSTLSFILKKNGARPNVIRTGEEYRPATKRSDIIIVAYGDPGLIKGHDIKQGSVLIDVGINRMNDGGIQGDVDRESVEGIAAWLTPVPGGVGPVTVATLLESTILAAEYLQK